MDYINNLLGKPVVPVQELTQTMLWVVVMVVAGGILIRILPWWMRASLGITLLGGSMLALVIAAKATEPHLPPQTQALVWLLVAFCGFVAALGAACLLMPPRRTRRDQPEKSQ